MCIGCGVMELELNPISGAQGRQAPFGARPKPRESAAVLTSMVSPRRCLQSVAPVCTELHPFAE
jgi:hypothetical protein